MTGLVVLPQPMPRSPEFRNRTDAMPA
jgi:hypothetical protein